jgi:hypothetical protein
MKLNNLNNVNDFDLDILSESIEPLMTYESVSSESTAHIFSSFLVENHPASTEGSDDIIETLNVNLCRPIGGLAVGLSFSMRRHIGLVHPSDCIGYIGSLNSLFGTYYNVLGPLLVGSHAFINEHSNCDFDTLKQSISVSKMTTMIISSETIKK